MSQAQAGIKTDLWHAMIDQVHGDSQVVSCEASDRVVIRRVAARVLASNHIILPPERWAAAARGLTDAVHATSVANQVYALAITSLEAFDAAAEGLADAADHWSHKDD